MTERIDIEEPLREICTRLGLDYARVSSLTITPGDVHAAVFYLDETGHKHLAHDGGAAVELIAFKTRS